MTHSKCIYAAAILSASLASGQAPSMFSAQTRSGVAVQGMVVRECANAQEKSFDNLRVEAYSRQNSNRSFVSEIRWDGGFDIREVPEGVYELQVVTFQGSVVKRTIVTVNSMSAHQEVQLAIPCAERPATGTVSLRRLAHKPPKNAVKALHKAAGEQRKGNVAEWEKQLRLATTLDPEYFEARNNYGAFLVRHGRNEEALTEFRAAIGIDPTSAAVLANMSACLLGIGRVRDAEEYARKALAIDPLSAQAHYLIGVALVKQNRLTEEAAGHLRDSGSTFPRALEVEAVIRDKIRRQTGE
jgi:Tfp pilus assembly protein PilF